MLLKNQWVNMKSKRKFKKYLKTNDNENTTTQNLWDAAKEILSRKFIGIQPYLLPKENLESFT